jgi:di/tricarboxylate transporter
MTPEIITVGIIFVAAIVLFISERVRVDVVSLLVLVSLVLTGLLTSAEAFAGFSNAAVITVWAVFIVSNAVQRSGAADLLANRLLAIAGNNEQRLLVVLMLTAGLISSVMNNVGAVAILLPPTMSMARRLNRPPSRFLMPLSFAALLGGNLTLIGTPPNILAAGLLRDRGLASFAFFDFTPIGAVALTIGILYIVTIGRWLLPNRTAGGKLSSAYPLHNYLTEMRVLSNSPLIGRTLEQQHIREKYAVDILYTRREENPLTMQPGSDRVVKAGDVVLVEGMMAKQLAFARQMKLEGVRDFSADTWTTAIDTPTLHLSEIAIAPRSTLNGHTLRQVDFRTRYNISVLAIRHSGEAIVTDLANLTLSVGDALLVQGTDAQIAQLQSDRDFLVLTTPAFEPPPDIQKVTLSLLVLAAVILSTLVGWLAIETAMVCGALLTVLLRIQTIEEAQESIDWKVVFLIAGMLPLGTALEKTGAATFAAELVVQNFGGWGPLAVLGAFFAFTALLTEVISNAAATVLVVPIAIEVAQQLSVSPQTFVIAVVLAASTSFMTPIGHQCNVLIFGPGGYKFSDYARVGLGLNILMLIVAVTILPLLWPF